MNTLGLIGIGFALGVRHAADTDHVVAVTAIAAGHRRLLPAALVGAYWGLGHTLTILGVGGMIVLLNLVVPPRLGLALEFVVGVALVVVGASNLTGHDRAGGTPGPGRVGAPSLSVSSTVSREARR